MGEYSFLSSRGFHSFLLAELPYVLGLKSFLVGNMVCCVLPVFESV